ncbi:uncharacterized protein LOC108704180 [Xenopus laevis]|uniref:Uncharacterized protein LOC108704180 n=1 Tax=Xenopus laevis TaxID=8355 RepID=A0A8J1LYV5_XENLA|nr:uncharacterized protein LOC108704180 [Xenopus laevis]
MESVQMMLVLMLLLPGTFVYAQLQVSTPPSPIVAQLGSSASLPCTFTLGVEPVDPAQVHVVWKKEGTKVLAYVGELSTPRPGAQLSEERLAQGDATLTLPNVTDSDTGRYSCNIRLSSEQDTQTVTLLVTDTRQIWVEGTMVVAEQSNELQCGASNLSSSDVVIEWVRNGQVLSTSAPHIVENTDDQGFMVQSSYCLTPTINDTWAHYSCQVLQKNFPHLLKKTFQLTLGARPDIFFLLWGKGQKNSSLVCLVSGFYPDELSVTLKKDGQVLTDNARKWVNPNGTFSLAVIYPFNVTMQDDNIEFTCTVTHPTIPRGTTERLCFLVDQYVPKVFWMILSAGLLLAFVLPSLCKHVTDIAVCKDWTEGSTAMLKCSISGLYPMSITAVWLVRQGEKELEIKERGSQHPVGDYRELQEQDSYTCWNIVKSTWVCNLRQSLSSVLCFQVQKDRHNQAEFICRFMRRNNILGEKHYFGNVLDNYGFYSVSEICIPEECNVGEKLTLTCCMQGNVPQEIRVMWERCQGEERTPISKEQDGTYHITENKSAGMFSTFLTFNLSNMDSGASFSCSFSENEGRILAERSSMSLKVTEPKENTWSKTYQDWGFRAFDETGITEI